MSGLISSWNRSRVISASGTLFGLAGPQPQLCGHALRYLNLLLPAGSQCGICEKDPIALTHYAAKLCHVQDLNWKSPEIVRFALTIIEDTEEAEKSGDIQVMNELNGSRFEQGDQNALEKVWFSRLVLADYLDASGDKKGELIRLHAESCITGNAGCRSRIEELETELGYRTNHTGVLW